MAYITVGALDKTTRIEVPDGHSMDLSEALRQHFELPDVDDVGSKLKDMVVRLNSEPQEDIHGVSVSAGSFVTIYAAEVSQGGVRGAAHPHFTINVAENGFILGVTENDPTDPYGNITREWVARDKRELMDTLSEMVDRVVINNAVNSSVS